MRPVISALLETHMAQVVQEFHMMKTLGMQAAVGLQKQALKIGNQTNMV